METFEHIGGAALILRNNSFYSNLLNFWWFRGGYSTINLLHSIFSCPPGIPNRASLTIPDPGSNPHHRLHTSEGWKLFLRELGMPSILELDCTCTCCGSWPVYLSRHLAA
jgi:hypothetical protein